MEAGTTTHTLTETGKGLDLSFLGKPHEHDPRRAYSTTATDWQARVDFDRMRRDRLDARPDDVGPQRPRRSRLLRGRERALPDGRLSGELEEQHLHPLRGAAS